MIWIAFNNAYSVRQDFPGEEARNLFRRISPAITKPLTHDEIVTLMDHRVPNAPPGYHNRMFHRLLVAGYFVNGNKNGTSSLYFPNNI